MDIQLIPADANDLPAISKLAEEIWFDYYPGIVTVAQIEYMLKKFYSLEALREQMGQGQKFYLIRKDPIPAFGYLSTTEREAGIWFMNKFYLKSRERYHGYGSAVLHIWEQIHRPKELSLQVNRRNFRSVNFYFKQGFRIKEAVDFDIGNGFSMDDFVMVKKYT